VWTGVSGEKRKTGGTSWVNDAVQSGDERKLGVVDTGGLGDLPKFREVRKTGGTDAYLPVKKEKGGPVLGPVSGCLSGLWGGRIFSGKSHGKETKGKKRAKLKGAVPPWGAWGTVDGERPFII